MRSDTRQYSINICSRLARTLVGGLWHQRALAEFEVGFADSAICKCVETTQNALRADLLKQIDETDSLKQQARLRFTSCPDTTLLGGSESRQVYCRPQLRSFICVYSLMRLSAIGQASASRYLPSTPLATKRSTALSTAFLPSCCAAVPLALHEHSTSVLAA